LAERAGLDGRGLGPRSTRKSWESWLVSSYPDRVLEVFLSQGHTQMTALGHYLNLPFTSNDKANMIEWVAGWENEWASHMGDVRRGTVRVSNYDEPLFLEQ